MKPHLPYRGPLLPKGNGASVFSTRLFTPGFTALLFLFCWQPGLLAQTIRYVKPGGTGNGTSWSVASGNLQSMINASAANDQVWVAAGMHKPAAGTGYTMKEGVGIYGGFAGNESSLSARNFRSNITILQGNGSRIIYNYNAGLSKAAVLDGFIITGGNASSGGGIVNVSDNPTFVNCTIVGNTAYTGGGVYNQNASPIFINCIISGNNATAISTGGGGVYNEAASPTLINCLISGNKTVGTGGAIFNITRSSPKIINCTVSGNNAATTGGVHNSSLSNPTITNCILWGDSYPEIASQYSSNPVVTYTNTQHTTYSGTGNRSVDPFFVDPQDYSLSPTTAGIYRLRGVFSQLTSQGDNAAYEAADGNTANTSLVNDRDLGGNSRLRNQAAKVDFGAYQFTGISPNINDVVHVKKGGGGAFNGSSWDNAFGEVLEAMDAASIQPNIKEIWVAAGSYPTVKGQYFAMKNGLRLYGGFAGTERNLTDRNWQTNVTILRGNGNRIFNNVNVTNTAILDGFTLTGGKAAIGGGMFNSGSSPVIRNCIFSGNTGTNSGGAIYNNSSSNPAITNCIFSENDGGTSGGGAIHNARSSPVITNCVFRGNKSGNGGAMYNSSTNLVIINCLFSGNKATGLYGGAMMNNSADPRIINCTFSGNHAPSAGGAIYNLAASHPVITNSIIYGNGTNELFNSDALNTLTIQHSIVKGGFAGTGNKDSDPLFVNPQPAGSAPTAAGDYRIKTGSPAINAGDNPSYENADGNAGNNSLGNDMDLAGNPRSKGTAVEMGAYEFQRQSQSINPVGDITKTYGDPSFEPGATATSGLIVAIVSADNSVAEPFQDAADGNKWKIRIKKAGTVKITASQPGNDDYDPAPNVEFNVTVNKKPVTVTADEKRKVYGDADPALTYTVSPALVPGDVFTGILGRYTGEDVGTYAIHQGTLALNENYTITFTNGNFNIDRKDITITAEAKNKVYGDPDPALTYTVSPALVGGDVFSGGLSRSTGEHVGVYVISKGSLALNNNYNILFTSSNFTISPKAITVTAESKSKIYGDADPALTYTFSPSLVAGDAFSGALNRASGENVGVYTINQGTLALNSNYNVSYTTNNLTISPKAITVTAQAKNKVYGDADPALTYTVSPSLVAGDVFNGALSRSTGENVGVYAINQGTLTLNSNYIVSYTTNNLTISPKAITVTAQAKNKVYGDADPALTYTVSPSLVAGDAFSGALSRTAGEHVGVYAIEQGTLALNSNYNVSYTTNNFTISPKVITVTAQAKNKVYGDADPALTYTVSPSLVAGDAFSGALSRTAGEHVGVYAIGQGTLAISINYSLTYAGNNLSIAPKGITVTADAKSKVYGNADPALTYTVSPSLVAGDAFSGTLSRSTGENVGVYAINQGTLALNSNYNVSYTTNNLTIAPRNVTVTAQAKNKVYGDADPVLTYTVSPSLIAGDAFNGTLSRNAGEQAGSYPINQNTLALSNNYQLTYIPANFVINKAILTVTATDKTICLGTSAGTIPVTYSGFKYSDNASSLNRTPRVSIPSFNAAGNYPLTPSGGSANNYSFSYINGQLTVLPTPSGAITQNQTAPGTTSGFHLTAPTGTEYLWSTGETTAAITVRASSNYSVKVTNQHGCSNNFITQIKFQTLSIPNTFSPNGDGINDYWVIPELSNYPNAYVIVVNRDGQAVFETKNFTRWDGRNRGNALPAGVYFYRVRKKGGEEPLTGWLNLVR